MSESKQSWLILSHAFNMDGRAASQTITDKIPHLRRLGVKPVVVSGVLGRQDRHIEHHQVLPALPVALRFDLRHYIRNRIANALAYRVLMVLVTLLLAPFYLLEKLLFPVETSWSWSISAYLVGRRLIERNRPTLIYSTGGAYAAHIAGYWLSRRYGLPWIVEIHDPMVMDSKLDKSYRERFLVRLERLICTRADLVWWFTEEALERARKRNPQLGERGKYVLAGVDAPAFQREPYQRGEQMVIGHFGSLSKTRNMQIFLKGLEAFLSRDAARVSKVRLHIYGGSMDPVSAAAIEAFPYSEVIEVFARLENDPQTGESGRTRVLKRMNAADCLLLLHGTVDFCEEYIPSKLYEYLWTERPILGLVHHNPQLRGILQQLGKIAVEAEHAGQVTDALESLYERWQGEGLPDSGRPSPYSTERAVGEIHTWVQQLIKA